MDCRTASIVKPGWSVRESNDEWGDHRDDGGAVRRPRLSRRSGRVLDHGGRAGRDRVYPDQLRLDRRTIVPRRRCGSVARSAVLPAGRRADDIREYHLPDDQSRADAGRAFPGRARAGRHRVQHVLRRDFRLLDGRRCGAFAHDRSRDGPQGYDRAFTAALIASASTMANLIPPSIMAVVYGAIGNVSIGGLFLGGIVPGLLVGFGLMIYSHFFGAVGLKRKRASLCQFTDAAKASALPLMIPIIILGGILSGWFTPTEAGLIAVAYIVFVLIPLINWRHVAELPLDFAKAGLLYSIPLI